MSPNEKAVDLKTRFENENLMFEKEILEDAVESALITVNEILGVLYRLFESYDEREYWDDVKKELENMLA